MSRLIKILYIDPDYQITYFIFLSRLKIRTSVPLQTAIALLKNEDFDLIVSEPHNKAILQRFGLDNGETFFGSQQDEGDITAVGPRS